MGVLNVVYLFFIKIKIIKKLFSKAFDTVDHHLLGGELESLGIGVPLLSWLKSYISGRKQSIKVNEAIFNLLEVISGIPLGSHLSPLLFNLFVNSLGTILPNAEIMLMILKYLSNFATPNQHF